MDETNKPHVLLWSSKCGKICRCCLANGDPRDLYEEIDAETFKDHLNLLVQRDRFLPNLICQKCANFVQDVRRFRETVDSSTKLLNAIIYKSNAKNQTTVRTRHSTERAQGGEVLDSPMRYSDAMVIIPDEHYSMLKDMDYRETDNQLSKELEATPLESNGKDQPPDNIIKDEEDSIMKDMELTEMDNQLSEVMPEAETPLELTTESACPPSNIKRRPSKSIIKALNRIGLSKSQKRRIEKINKQKIQNGRVIKAKWLSARNRDKIKNFKKVTKKLLDNSREMMKKSKQKEKTKYNKLKHLNGRIIKNNGIRIKMGSKGPRVTVKNMDDLIAKALTRNSKDLVSVSDNDKNEGTPKNNAKNNENNGPIVLVKNIDEMIKNLTKNDGALVSAKDDNKNRGTPENNGKNNGNNNPIVLIKKNIENVVKNLTANDDSFVSVKDNNENGRKPKNNGNNSGSNGPIVLVKKTVKNVIKGLTANDNFIPVKDSNENGRKLKNNGFNSESNGPIVLVEKNIDHIINGLAANDNFVSLKDNNENATPKKNGKNNGNNGPIVLVKKNIDHVINGLAANDNFISVKDNNENGGTLKNKGKNNGNNAKKLTANVDNFVSVKDNNENATPKNNGNNGPIVLVKKNIDHAINGLAANDNFISVKDNNENGGTPKNNGKKNGNNAKKLTANVDNFVSVKDNNENATPKNNGNNGPIVFVKRSLTVNDDSFVSVKDNGNGRKLNNNWASNCPIVLVKKNIEDIIKGLAASGGTLVSISDIKLKSSMSKKH